MKKAAVIFIIYALLTAVLCGCKSGKPDVTTDTEPVSSGTEAHTAEQTDAPEYTPALPNERFDGVFNILCAGGEGSAAGDLYAENDGVTANGARLRAEALKNRFGVELAVTLSEDTFSALRLSVMGGDKKYDAVVGTAGSMASNAASGDLLDLNGTEGADLSKSYWDQNANKYLSVGGKLYFAAGDILTSDDDHTRVIIFNKQLARDYGIGDLYKTVESGGWTFDRFYSVIKGDGTAAIISDGSSSFALAADCDAAYGFFYSAGLTFTAKNESDVPFFDSSQDRTKKVQDVLDYSLKVLRDGALTYDASKDKSEGGASDKLAAAFCEGRTLFCCETLSAAARYRREGVDTGILPMPKFDAYQKEYLTYVDPEAMFVGIPAYRAENGGARRCGAILEALAYYGYKYITPDHTASITGGNLKDASMLETVFKNRIYDLGLINDWGTVASSYMTLVSENKNNYTASFSRISRSAKNKLDNFLSKILG